MRVERGTLKECPRCRTSTLDSGAIDPFELSVCQTCRGLFLPFRSTNRLRLVSKPSKTRVIGGVLIHVLDLLDLIQFVFW